MATRTTYYGCDSASSPASGDLAEPVLRGAAHLREDAIGVRLDAPTRIGAAGDGALETLARARVVVLDKTGTLTAGTPRVADVEVFDTGSGDHVLRLTASLDQVSPHVFAPAAVSAAAARGPALSLPDSVEEHPGTGIRGAVPSRGWRWVPGAPRPRPRPQTS